MQTFKSIAVSAALVLSAISGAAFAARPERFMNGESVNGQPTQATTKSRTMDVAAVKSVHVAYGETLRFVNAGKTFSWQFNGLDNRHGDFQHIAPTDFSVKTLNIYVDKSPFNQN